MKLYVGNLSYETSEAELNELFSAFGEAASVRILTDDMSGRSKGFGFVEFNDDEQAKAAMAALNGKEVRGRAIVVNEARPRPARGGPGGRGGFGGNRGGGGGGGRSGGGFGGGRRTY